MGLSPGRSEARLPAVEPLGQTSGRRRLHAADAGDRAEQVRGEPGPAGLGREVLQEQARPCVPASRRGGGAKKFGDPKSPSYFGISYSRMRWSRQVFQVSSETSRWSWCRSSPVVGEDEVRRELALQRLELVLHRRAGVGEEAVAVVADDDRRGSGTPSRNARRRGARLRRALGRRAEDDPQRPRGRGARPARRRSVPPQPISMSSQCAPRARILFGRPRPRAVRVTPWPQRRSAAPAGSGARAGCGFQTSQGTCPRV